VRTKKRGYKKKRWEREGKRLGDGVMKSLKKRQKTGDGKKGEAQEKGVNWRRHGPF